MDSHGDTNGRGDWAGSDLGPPDGRGGRLPPGGPAADHPDSSRLLTALAHDIRTPLNAMLLTLRLLENKLGLYMDDEDRADFTLLRTEIWAVLDLHEGILEHARLACGRLMLDVSEFSLDETLGACIQVVRPLATQKGLAIIKDLRVNEAVRSDRTMLQHVVANLLSNAVRYTRQGHITVRSRLDGNVVWVEVEDTGIGISSEDRARIFEAYFRADAARDESGAESHGLGLAMARQMVGLLGGNLTVASEVGRGSLFTLALPRSVPGPPSQTTPSHEADRSEPRENWK
jgi:signal transduction histidine kinase